MVHELRIQIPMEPMGSLKFWVYEKSLHSPFPLLLKCKQDSLYSLGEKTGQNLTAKFVTLTVRDTVRNQDGQPIQGNFEVTSGESKKTLTSSAEGVLILKDYREGSLVDTFLDSKTFENRVINKTLTVQL